MASSLAQQLQAIKSIVQADSAPFKRPFTRPSILYDPKEAADIDVETILNVALSGLEVLISKDERFRNYKHDLFSHKSIEFDRELKGKEENNRISSTISSYLRLLSGHIQLHASLKTLEYLIRRYKIHVYDTEDLILCAMPYHDTHAFVRIVQLIDTGNSKWKFLEGVKMSGAPPPRCIIVQQCIRDMGVLEVLCNYASPSKKFQPSRPVISFCIAVVVEVLGSVTTVNSDLVKKILPFVVSGLQTGAKGGPDHKAGALMIVGLLANKVELAPKLVKSLIRSIAEIAREDARELTDLQWFRLSLMALISLVQLQSIDVFPKKALECLVETREIAGIILGLFREFNIDRFLTLLLESLVEYSSSNDSCHLALLSIIETVPVKNLVGHLVFKVLSSCVKLLQKKSDSTPPESGSWAKKILVAINNNYPSELHQAVWTFLEDKKVQAKKGDATFEILSTMLDGNLDSSTVIPDSKIWLALNHPKAEVRRATLSGLKASGFLKSKEVASQRFVNIRDAILCQLRDDDLTVVQEALCLDGFSEILGSSDVLEALQDVLHRCYRMSSKSSLAGDVAYSFLKIAISCFHNQIDNSKQLATIMFPFILIFPETQRLNLKVLELAKEVEWPVYQSLTFVSSEEMLQKLKRERVSSINLETVDILAETFLLHHDEYMPWFIKSCDDLASSKTLFYLVLMRSFILQKSRRGHSFAFFEACFPVLKSDWEVVDSAVDISISEFNTEMLDADCRKFLDQLFDTDVKALNTNILICVLWRLLEAFVSTMPSDVVLDDNDKWVIKLRDMFVFFATSRLKHVFKEHLHYLVTKSNILPGQFLSGFFTEEDVLIAAQVESLHCFAFVCSQSDDSLLFQLLVEFPSLLVPLSSSSQDTRIAAMGCIKGLHALCPRVDFLRNKNGNNATWSHSLDELLGLMVQQKRLILSDKNFLPSFLTSLLGSSCNSIMVPRNLGQRFDQSTKEKIIAFILGSSLKLSTFSKLMIFSLLKGLGNAIIRIKDVELLLSMLLKRRNEYFLELDMQSKKLSKTEVKILCLLLESCVLPASSSDGCDYGDYLLKALQVHNTSSDDPSIIEPCVAVLQNLTAQFYSGLTTEMQELLFQELVLLFHNANGKIQNATREAILRLNITWYTIVKTIEFIFAQENRTINMTHGKKKKKKSTKHHKFGLNHDVICKGENTLSVLSSLLDVLVLKKAIVKRDHLLGSLFKLLRKIFSDDWVNGILAQNEEWSEAPTVVSQTLLVTISHIQQTLLIILEDIIGSFNTSVPLKDDIINEIDVKLLVECAHSAKAGVTRNHIFSVLTSTANAIPKKISEHIFNIFIVVGESTVSQIDSHSLRVFEDFISVVVPCWLSETGNPDKLLQIFVNVLPHVAEHRRLSIVVYLLRTLGESNGLASLVMLLFRSLVARKGLTSLDDTCVSDSITSSALKDWEYAFALQICEQYSCMIWLPCLVRLLKEIEANEPCYELFMVLVLAMELILHKMHDPELGIRLESGENLDKIQTALGELMEQAVALLERFDVKKKQTVISVRMRRELKECMHAVFRSITRAMVPLAYFRGITNLLGHVDPNVRKKALGLLCEAVRYDGQIKSKHKDRRDSNPVISNRWLHMNESAMESFHKMCMEIIQIVENSIDESSTSLKLAAFSALEVLARRFPSNHSIFSMCLKSVTKCITSHNLIISSSCLRATGALVDVLGLQALSELPRIMETLIKKSREITSCVDVRPSKNDSPPTAPSISNESIMLSVLVTLEAVIDKLGDFLSPYLEDIIDLLLLSSEYTSEPDSRLKLRADTLRKLLTDKITARLALPPLFKVHSRAVESGDSSMTLAFEMLASVVCKMDRSCVAGYHGKIFSLCLDALDLRRQRPVSIRNINTVEKSVVNAMISLTMKLTETMFKPLFIRSIEWAESDVEELADNGITNIDRAISFFGFVNKLAENHRSLFVPYFKYLLEGCARYLTDVGDVKATGFTRKKKKAKIQAARVNVNKENNVLAVKKWHLRSLILSSLHKCFLYDTGDLKFLDSSNFQILLKPIVSQLATEPPASLEEFPDTPSVKEVDDLLVVCIGQMAVTAESDLLWKPLNHEVLMQTRSDQIRARILGLRIVRYLLDSLKEEYTVLLPETFPFIGELLEDGELTVRSLAQDFVKEVELMTNEDIREYL